MIAQMRQNEIWVYVWQLCNRVTVQLEEMRRPRDERRERQCVSDKKENRGYWNLKRKEEIGIKTRPNPKNFFVCSGNGTSYDFVVIVNKSRGNANADKRKRNKRNQSMRQKMRERKVSLCGMYEMRVACGLDGWAGGLWIALQVENGAFHSFIQDHLLVVG